MEENRHSDQHFGQHLGDFDEEETLYFDPDLGPEGSERVEASAQRVRAGTVRVTLARALSPHPPVQARCTGSFCMGPAPVSGPPGRSVPTRGKTTVEASTTGVREHPKRGRGTRAAVEAMFAM